MLGKLILVVPPPVGPAVKEVLALLYHSNLTPSSQKLDFKDFLCSQVGVSPGDSASVCNWVVELAAEQPGGKLVDLNLRAFSLHLLDFCSAF